jgi:hypothetical protein
MTAPEPIASVLARARAAQAEAGDDAYTDPAGFAPSPEVLAAERRRSLLDIAKARGVKGDEDILRVVVMDEPEPRIPMLAMRAMMEYARGGEFGRRGCIVLLGWVTDAGKSCAGAWHVARVPRGQTGDVAGACYVLASEITTTARGWGANDDKWRLWLHTPLLFIDEVGRGPAKPDVMADLLMSRRYAGLATGVAGNVLHRRNQRDMANFEELLGLDAAFFRRLDEQRQRGLEWEIVCAKERI